MLLRQTAAAGAADLHSLELSAVLQTAADVEDDLPQGGAHGHFDEAGIFNGTGQGEGLTAGGAGGTDGLEPVSAVQDDLGDVGVGLDVVQDSGLLPQALLNGSGGLGTGHTAVALDGGGQSGALAADECARAAVDVQAEVEVGAQDVVTQQTALLQLTDGVSQSVPSRSSG